MELAFVGIGAAIGGGIAGVAGATASTVMSAIGLGWMMGSFIYNLLLAPKQQSYGARLKDKDVQVSTYGAAIALVYGTVRLAGNMIWADEIKEHKSTQTVGKGGGGTTITTYWYSCSFAVAFCEGEIESLLKIWLDDKLVYNITGDSDTITKDSTLNFKFYSGSETQLPDPTIQAIKGVDNTPAYRGICYIVLKNLKLTRYGNRLPNVRVLIGNSVAVEGAMEPITGLDESLNHYTHGYYYGLGPVLTPTGIHAVINLNYWDGTYMYGVWYEINCLTRTVTNTRTYTHLESDGSGTPGCWPGCGGCSVFMYAYCFDIDELGRIFTITCEGYGQLIRLSSTFSIERQTPYNLSEEFTYPGYDPGHAKVVWVSKNPAYPYVWVGNASMEVGSEYPGSVFLFNRETLEWKATFTHPDNLDTGDASVDVAFYPGAAALNNTTGSAYVYFTDYYRTSHCIACLNPDGTAAFTDISSHILSETYVWHEMCYDEDTDQLILHGADDLMGPGTSGSRLYFFNASTLTLNGSVVIGYDLNGLSQNISNFKQGVVDGRLYLNTMDSDDNPQIEVIDVVAMAVVDTITLDSSIWSGFNSVYIAANNSMLTELELMANDDYTVVRSISLDRKTPETVILADIVEDVCNRCDLSDLEINTAQLTDLVDGYIIDNVMTGIDAVRPLAQAYLFDGVEADGYLQFIKRGQMSTVTIPEDDLAAHQDSDERPQPLRQTITQDLELPQELSVQYFDKDANQEVGTQLARRLVTSSLHKMGVSLPVVMDHNKAKQLADILLQWTWTSRVAFEFSVGTKYLYLVPTDVVTLQTTEATYQAVITDMSLEGGIIRCRATQDYETLYLSTASGTALPMPDENVDWVGPSIWYLLDLPSLQTAERDASGIYGVGNGYTDAWSGCSILSLDPITTNWLAFIDVTNRAVTGIVSNALGGFTNNIFDCKNTITVRLDYEDHYLEACTEAELLADYNCALVGDEIIQFQYATENADKSWTLSKLLRGRRGTEWAIGTHIAGERFVALSDTAVFWASINPDYQDVELSYRGVTHGNDFSEGITKLYTPTFATLKPWSVVHATFASSATQTTVSWIRRNRYDNGWSNIIEVPMSETTESYSVDFYTGATVTMTKTVDTPTCTVSVASMSGITSCSIYQVSSAVGRGWGTEVVF